MVSGELTKNTIIQKKLEVSSFIKQTQNTIQNFICAKSI